MAVRSYSVTIFALEPSNMPHLSSGLLPMLKRGADYRRPWMTLKNVENMGYAGKQ